MIEKKLLGEILVEQKLVLPEQLQIVLELQKKTTPYQTIGRHIIKQGFMKEADLQLVLEQTGKRERLGEIFFRCRFVDKDDLLFALEMARQEQLPLGTVLKNLDFIDDEIMSKAIAIQYDLQFVHINTIESSPELVNVISPGYAKKHKIAPISKTSETVVLAMVQPMEIEELKDLETLIRLKIQPVIALESEILALQERFLQ